MISYILLFKNIIWRPYAGHLYTQDMGSNMYGNLQYNKSGERYVI